MDSVGPHHRRLGKENQRKSWVPVFHELEREDPRLNGQTWGNKDHKDRARKGSGEAALFKCKPSYSTQFFFLSDSSQLNWW